MAWERKIMRVVRARNEQKIGVLANLLASISENGGSIGSIQLLNETSQHVVRDITVYADDEASFEHVLAAMRANAGTVVVEVRDEVLELHQKGKIAVRSRYQIDSMTTLRRVYTPGVAEVCRKIAADPSLARLYTSISHMVAIVTDGTAVLGLGDIGPQAAMPVMEGKAMLMETLVGLSGVPILLDTKDPDEIVQAVAAIAPTFAAIQLEDISTPRCFEIESRLQEMLDIPVMHDDQHGTAVVCTAALLVAARETSADLRKAVIGQIILALSNPNAEIEPSLALERGAAFAADGKSVNNVLGFPGIFRGAVDTNAPRITHEMLLAAAETIAAMTPPGDLVPNPLDKGVHHAVARAVAEKAYEQGIARADYVPYVEE